MVPPEGESRSEHLPALISAGVFRRRLRIEECGAPGGILVSLEDDLHGIKLYLRHQHRCLISIETEFIRAPYDTCRGSYVALESAIGKDLNEICSSVHKICVPASNCTHLIDMLRLAAHHVLDSSLLTQYDVIVTDRSNSVQIAFVYCNGALVHQWRLRGKTICEPESLRGLSIMQGFFDWVNKTYSGKELVAATILQRGIFVSSSRRMDIDSKERRASNSPDRIGACHTYSTELARVAKPWPNIVRDFTNAPEELLTFQ